MSKIKGDVITCNDCGLVGYCIIDGLDYTLSSGWIQVWVGLKRRHLCPSCREKRKKFGEKLMREREVDN